ncbi:MAG: hypothetical protein IT176_02515 [Acidobacteria bacterium]|nr:hypothetical protein [Acidobacteriota bacterium]
MAPPPGSIEPAARRRRSGDRLFAAACAAGLVVLAPAAARAQRQPAGDRPANHRIDAEGRLMIWQQQLGASAGGDRSAHDFLIRRARVAVQARPSERLSVTIQAGQDNVGASFAAPDDGFTIKDAYLNYRQATAFQIAVGQFKVPFLRANLESGFNQILVDRGTLSSLRPARQGSRDLGAMAWGNLRRSQYRLALLDGSDQDGGDAGWRFTGRIAQNWFASEPGLGYTGTSVGTTRVLQLAAQYDLQDARLDSRDDAAFGAQPRDYRAWAIEGYWEQPVRRWALTTEAAWLDRRDDYAGRAIDRHISGYYAQGAVLLPGAPSGRLQIAARRENWSATREGAGDAPATRTTLGGTYYFAGHARKIQADYTVKHGQPELRNELRASYVVTF